MPFNPLLAKRIELILESEEVLTSKKMFGGMCFMIHGNMCCGVEKDRLVLRVGPALYESILTEKHILPFDFTGRALKGFVYVQPRGILTDIDLRKWIGKALTFVHTLPPK